MTDQPAAPPVRVTVYGSCVARDAVDLAGGGRLAVTDYIARQSLLSAGSDASARFPADAQVSSPFQRRMMVADFAGDLERRLSRAAATTARNVLLAVLAAGPVPRHVAFVMDGNRRYARSHHKRVQEGHAEGFIALRRVRLACPPPLPVSP